MIDMASEKVRIGDDDTERQPERNPDTLPTSRDPSGRCPRCDRVSSFKVVLNESLLTGVRGSTHGTLESVAVLQCLGCIGKTAVIEETDRFGAAGHRFIRGVSWWPTPGADGVDTSVPENIADAYSEGVRCIGVAAPHAAVAMFRTALAHIVDDKGSDEARKQKDLFRRVEQMVADKTLWESFGDWATHIRETGNAGAHPEKFEPVKMEQATDLQRFIRQLIEFLYIQPARLRKAMPAKKRSKL